MKKIERTFDEELYLTSETGRYLYHTYAEHLPIIDYHCHLNPREIAEDHEFVDLGEMWLSGDHYKWRCMRTFGIDERYITGDASYYEKYRAFVSILPKLVGNPIYIWCALELKRYFDIDEPLTDANADAVYEKTCAMIREQHITRRWCMERSNVRLVSTTEDPIDDLRWHKIIAESDCKTRVITAFRPDKAMFIDKPGFPAYVEKLSEAAGMPIQSFQDLLDALESRLKYFQAVTGTTVSDDGIPFFAWADYTDAEAEAIFKKGLLGQPLSQQEADQYRSAFLFNMGRIYNRNHYVMQLHIGTYLDANTSRVERIGQSTGFDCSDDATAVISVGKLLDALTRIEELPKVILYPLDGTKIENWAILAAGFCDSGTKGKVQLGAPWWFNDTVYGIERQFAACANLYPLSLSVGMLTDSRSFISYPRHELYRRILCNYLGELVEKGAYFSSEENLADIIRDICVRNTNEFFDFGVRDLV
ncbi:MAG: glucuronate isomerase [Clostridia bacterium]|nr:glucuronate isomerase [Clostridia bacterium]